MSAASKLLFSLNCCNILYTLHSVHNEFTLPFTKSCYFQGALKIVTENCLKARIHCEIFLSEHFMKYIFHDSFSLCKLPINVHDILFEAFLRHFLYRERLSFWICLINSFVINDVCKNLNQNVNIKVKSKHKVIFRTLYWKNYKIDSSSFFQNHEWKGF